MDEQTSQPPAGRHANELLRKMADVADALDVDFTPVLTQLYNSINQLIYAESQKPEGQRSRVGGKLVVNAFLRAVYARYGTGTAAALAAVGIHSGADIGKVIFAMCEQNLMMAEAEDKPDDFNGLFEAETLEAYLKTEQLLPIRKQDPFRIVANTCYGIGLILVAGNYARIVPHPFGWIGWGIGMTGWALLTFRPELQRSLWKRSRT